MPRTATGNVFESRGKLYARVRVGDRRPAFPLRFPPAERPAADARGLILATIARDLAPLENPDLADRILRDAAVADDKKLATILSTVARLAAGKLAASSTPAPGSTFGEVANAWTSGALAKRYPDHVNKKKSASHDAQRLAIYVLPLLERTPLRELTREHGNLVLASMPPALSKATRRQVAQLVHRVAAIAVEPLGILAANPFPRGWMPKVRRADQRPQEAPYPDEVDQLLACAHVALELRLFVGFMSREGMRHDEGASLDWADIDLDRGFVTLEENKTDDPRRWPMNAGCLRALRRWHVLRGAPNGGRPVFVDGTGQRIRDHGVALRAAYEAAKVDRPALQHGTKTTSPSGFHGLRALFVTEALAHDRSEKWISLRTGHGTSDMIRTYDRAAAAFREAGIPASGPLDELIGLIAPTVARRRDDEIAAPSLPVEARGSGSGLGSNSEGAAADSPSGYAGFRRVESNHDSGIQSPLSYL